MELSSQLEEIETSGQIASRLCTQSSDLQTATLLICIGPHMLKIYDSLPFGNEEKKTNIETVIELLDAYFICDIEE